MWEESDCFGGGCNSGTRFQGMLVLECHLNIQLEMSCWGEIHILAYYHHRIGI